jgi:hypothetical protein
MRRTGLGPLVIAVVSAALLGACGSTSTSRPATGSHGLTVSPTTATPTSQIRFGFTAPQTAGRHGHLELGYVLAVFGPRRPGCVGVHSSVPPSAIAGRATSVELGPRELGGHWCTGSYAARVQEYARPACSAGQICPQYIRLVGTVAKSTFRVVVR